MAHPKAPPTLSPDEVLDLYRAVLDNAIELTEEAEIMLGASHRCRAYALAHLAHEEIAKCIGLLSIWVGLQVRGVPPQWELFWRKWSKHEFKVQLAMVGDMLRLAVGGEVPPAPTALTGDEELPPDAFAQMRALLRTMEAAIAGHTDLVQLRTAATYVDFVDGKVVRPAEVVSEEMAANMVQVARLNCNFFAQAGALLQSALPAMAGHPLVEQVIKALAEAGAEESAAARTPATVDPAGAIPAASADSLS